METLEGRPAHGHPRPSRKFGIPFIQMVLSEVADGLSVPAANAKYNLVGNIIRTWNRKYGQHELPVVRRTLSSQEKRSLLRAVAKDGLSVRNAAIIYGVGESSIHQWLKHYPKENEELSSSNQLNLKKRKTKHQPGTSGEHVRQLQQQLADAQLKIAALNTLIDVAEEQLKINIRKKPGARQS